ncbi:acetyl-CoA decarbonylase/synthase complex subunit gamma [[Eubacterium] cellulosolvens]
MSEKENKKIGIKDISPLDIYNLLPRTNCKLCGEENCMAFSTKVVNRELELEKCTPLLEEKYKNNFQTLWDMLKPPVKTVKIGNDSSILNIGGEFVMYRHEFTYYNPTAIAIDVTDNMKKQDLIQRSKLIQDFTYNYIGRKLKLDLIAVRSVTNQPDNFAKATSNVTENTEMPVILCSHKPEVIKAGLEKAINRRPLIYAATKDNWSKMADLALDHNSPLVVSATNDLKLLRSLTKTLVEYGVEDLVLDPGTISGNALHKTVDNFTMLRRLSCKENDELLGFPLLGAPISIWTESGDPEETMKWKETCLASMLITRYADILIMHSLDGWALLPTLILRDNLYTDPRKPVAVESGLKSFGKPDENSPVMMTTNFALTYYTVASDIEKIDSHLIVIDSEGNSVESSVAGRKLTADKVKEAIDNTGISEKVKHKKLIIPGRASRISGEIEEATGWDVLVGPLDSSGIAGFLKDKWSTDKNIAK